MSAISMITAAIKELQDQHVEEYRYKAPMRMQIITMSGEPILSRFKAWNGHFLVGICVECDVERTVYFNTDHITAISFELDKSR
jgi:hypothetical protein